MANASRVLPLVTSAHFPSAANHEYWPEIYDNMPIVPGSEPRLTPIPRAKIFRDVSPLDPQLFSTIADHAGDLLAGRSNPKYSPIEVAQWVEDYTAASAEGLSKARVQATAPTSPEFRRMEEDVLIQNGLGRFFAAKLRSGVLFEIYQQTGNATPANSRWPNTKQHAMRGRPWHRAPIASTVPTSVTAKLRSAGGTGATGFPASIRTSRRCRQSCSSTGVDRIGATASRRFEPPPADRTGPPSRAPTRPPQVFTRAAAPIVPAGPRRCAPSAVHLYYRHVDQAERWLSMEMRPVRVNTLPRFPEITRIPSIRCSTTLSCGVQRFSVVISGVQFDSF